MYRPPSNRFRKSIMWCIVDDIVSYCLSDACHTNRAMLICEERDYGRPQ